MESEDTGMKFFYAFMDLLLLNVAVVIVYSLSPAFSQLNLSDKNLYYLHANISEIIAYALYSKRNYYFRDLYKNRVKYLSKRMLLFIVILFLLAQIFLHKKFSYLFLFEYTVLFYILKLVAFYFIYKFFKYRRRKGHFVHRAVI